MFRAWKQRMILAQKQTCRSMEPTNRRPRYKPTHLWTPDLTFNKDTKKKKKNPKKKKKKKPKPKTKKKTKQTNKQKTHYMQKRAASSTKGARIVGHPHIDEGTYILISHPTENPIPQGLKSGHRPRT